MDEKQEHVPEEELDGQDAELLPDREAMSLIMPVGAEEGLVLDQPGPPPLPRD